MHFRVGEVDRRADTPFATVVGLLVVVAVSVSLPRAVRGEHSPALLDVL